MEPSLIPLKTDLGRLALQRRESLPHAHRLFLIMIDGRKSLGELAQVSRGLGVDDAVLAALVDRGLIAWQVPPGRRESIAAEPPAAATSSTAGSLAAAKMYALDLAALMLPGRDGELREAARQATDARAMRAWLQAAARLIATHAGGERSALFLRKVEALMPRDLPAPAGAR